MMSIRLSTHCPLSDIVIPSVHCNINVRIKARASNLIQDLRQADIDIDLCPQLVDEVDIPIPVQVCRLDQQRQLTIYTEAVRDHVTSSRFETSLRIRCNHVFFLHRGCSYDISVNEPRRLICRDALIHRRRQTLGAFKRFRRHLFFACHLRRPTYSSVFCLSLSLR